MSIRCQVCKKLFLKPANCSLRSWNDGYRKNCSFECRVKNQIGKFGKMSNKWQKIVNYTTIHGWLKRHYGKAVECENRQAVVLGFPCCQKSNNFQWASKTKGYVRSRDAFYMLCIPCHKKFDLKRGSVVKGTNIRSCYFDPKGRMQNML